MRSKRLLTLFMVLCLLISVVSPAAAAVEIPTGSSINTGSATDSANKFNDLLTSVGDALGLNTLRNPISGETIVREDGKWVVSSTDKSPSASLIDAELPECIKQLREAAEYYSVTDVVSAFVVLEDDPMAERYSSITNVPSRETALLSQKQDAVIDSIATDVLGGEDPDVITRFTYLSNSVVLSIEFGHLEAIASLPGVKSVFLSPVYYPCQTSTESDPYTVTSGQLSNVPDVWADALGYTGSGMTIAILDTGLDLDHPSFAADPVLGESSWDLEYLESMVSELNAAQLYAAASKTGAELTAEDLYYSAKIPFAFNYATGTTNVLHNDNIGDHGTHVAGIAAANNVEGSGVVGMAPDAQIVVMKVFSSQTGGANMYDIINALEDAMRLGCDVANLSLGSNAGFSTSGIDEIDEIYERIAQTDMIVDIAAGNEGNSSYGDAHGNYMNPTEHIDNSTMSSPATYPNAMAVGSVNNSVVYNAYFTLADGTVIYYMQSVEYLYGYIDYSLEILAGGEMEYVVIDGLGTEEDFYDEEGNSIVEGKIAIVPRGEISFHEKAINAQYAGAAACMIWNMNDDDIFSFGMTTEGDYGIPGIPVVLVSMADGQMMADAESKTLTVSDTLGARPTASGGQVSSFSAWGVTPDLRLLPDISGVGGNVYSCYDGGQYGLMSGTSMATPQVAGITALVLQYLKETFPEATDEQVRVLVDSLMMSTAVPVIDNTTGVEASPRQQGAGLVNALYAITSEAYLTVSGSERPKAELFDSEDGVYSFTFTVHNFGEQEKTYTISSSLLCEDYAEDPNWPGMYFMAGTEHVLDNSAVTFSAESVTVAPGGSVDVTVSIVLTDADKEWIDTYFPNGNYVEGFVRLDSEDGVDLNLPFMGFYGDWTDAPIFDTGYWYGSEFWGIYSEEPEANEYYHVFWTDLAGTDWVLGFNPYTGALVDEFGNMIYDSANNVLSPNGDGQLDGFLEIYLSLMRNAQYVNMTYSDAEGNILDVQTLDYLHKTMFNSNYGSVVPFVYSWYYYLDELYDFTDENGDPLPSGTQLYLTITGALDYGNGRITDAMYRIPILIDTEAPVIVGQPQEIQENGRNYLVFTIEDDSLAYAALMNPSGTRYYADASDLDFVDNEDGTYTVTMDITGCGSDFLLMLGDYGTNEAYYDVTFTAADNMPVVDTDALYAYRVHDELIGNYYGYDWMFGWVSIDKETTEVTDLVSDAYEYYALTAAEYAGGYVFAVDAGYNFIVMQPGLWDRNVICNLGVNVIDMAFDETTGTMWMTTKTDYDYILYTVDLLTGELTYQNMYWDPYNMPWAMTFVDGQLYCIKNYDSGFYMVDMETFDLIPVTDAEGNEIRFVTSTGKNAVPYYSQSMTYSESDGLIYWAYYSYRGLPELFAINPEDMTYTSVPFEWDQEFVGLLTLDDDGYTLPQADAIEQLVISDYSMVLSVGEMGQLSVSGLPWNAPLGEVTWTSSDESVAVVQDGYVLGVGEGSALITAECDGHSADCMVSVVQLGGSFYAYDYYSADDLGYGYWLSTDIESMTEEALFYSPVDFIAADYNGHDGYIYGYNEVGQCYRYNPETGDCVALGEPVNMLVADMAYDYSTGFMYAIVYDAMMWTTTIYYVNMSTGALTAAATAYDIYLTLACDMYGYLYAISYDGILYLLSMVDMGMGGGGGIMPWSVDGSSTMYVEAIPFVEGLGTLQYQQSMCYDHVNDVILWTNPETSCVYWIDLYTSDMPFVINLGDPSGSGLIEYVGMFVVPEQIPELAYMPVEDVQANDMVLLEGATKMPAVTVYPLNATNSEISYVSDDETIAAIVNGAIVGVGVGSTTITGTLTDVDPDGNVNTIEFSFQVNVKMSTDNIVGYIATDLLDYSGGYWANLYDSMPGSYEPFAYAEFDGMMMMIYSAEHVGDYIYAYGYDMNDYSASWQYMIIDAASFTVVESVSMGLDCPFVYDMAYDYSTGTMYAVAGPSDTISDLYMVNMENGDLIECMLTEQMFLNLTVDADGNIYGMSASESTYDPWSWSYTYTSAKLYKLDPVAGTCEVVLDTGKVLNALSSMAYDFDTGYIYWTGMEQGGESGLFLIDLEAGTCDNLGLIGAGGAQVTGLMIFADSYPEVPAELCNAIMGNKIVKTIQGGTVALSVMTQPSDVDVQITWTSANTDVATVDENGVVTGVGAGVTVVTATVTDGVNTCSASCRVIVYGEDDYYISYNWTDGGFCAIDMMDPSNVIALTEGESEPGVMAMVMIDGVIYAYDADGNLFTTSVESGFVRTYVGHHAIELPELDSEGNPVSLTIRDMAWDAKQERLLVLACTNSTNEYDETYEHYAGCRIYEADLTTGALSEVCIVGGEMMAESGVCMLEVTDQGDAYIFTYYDDYVCSLDLETGEVSRIVSFSSQGIYASADGYQMSMTYDCLTESMTILLSSSRGTYSMYSFDLGNNSLTEIGRMYYYDRGSWSYVGDEYAGLILANPHTHSFGDWVTEDATCTENGHSTRTCPDCGATESEVIEATGHEYDDSGVCVHCGHCDVILGDANGDGDVNNVDAMLILQYYVGVCDSTGLYLNAMDVNCDGSINNVDAMLVLQYYVGVITEFPKA